MFCRNEDSSWRKKRLAGDVIRTALLLLYLILSPHFVMPAFAQKVSLDYDKSADFSRFRTYAWVQGTPVANPTLDLYIKGAVDGMLTKKDMHSVAPDQADVFLTYHAATNGDVRANSFQDPSSVTTGGIPQPGQTVWDSAPAMGTSATLVRKGGISFEMFDRSQHKLVWSSRASGTLKEKRGEKLDQIDKALIKIFEAYPPKKKKGSVDFVSP